MKKVLFATTAIVATSIAGVSFAQGVDVSGEARLGLIYVDDGTDDDVDGTSRIRVKFAASGTSDSGLTFGFNVRADNAVGGQGQGADDVLDFDGDDCEDGVDDLACAGRVGTAGDVFVSGAFGTLTYGDTDSGSKKRVSNVDAISLTGLGDQNEIRRTVQDGPRIRYDYDFDSFGFSLSTEGEINSYSIGASYSGDFGGTTIDFGIGYDDVNELDHISASLGVGFGAFGLKVAYETNDVVDMNAAVSVSYDAGDLDIAAFYRTEEADAGDEEGYGIGASYDLGGGLVAKAGIQVLAVDGADDLTAADLGLAMTF